jgi:uncharacterized membrane protein
MTEAETGHLARFAMGETLKSNIAALQKRRREEIARRRWPERAADAITRFTGSITFVLIHLVGYGLWTLVNIGVVPGVEPFDPSFVMLASEASVEAIFLSTFVLISQNRMAAAADARADLDLHINLLAEHELTRLAVVLEAIARKLEVRSEADGDLAEVKRDVEPVAVMDVLAADPDRD